MPVRDLTDPSCPTGMRLDGGPAATLDVGKTQFFACAKMFVLRDAPASTP